MKNIEKQIVQKSIGEVKHQVDDDFRQYTQGFMIDKNVVLTHRGFFESKPFQKDLSYIKISKKQVISFYKQEFFDYDEINCQEYDDEDSYQEEYKVKAYTFAPEYTNYYQNDKQQNQKQYVMILLENQPIVQIKQKYQQSQYLQIFPYEQLSENQKKKLALLSFQSDIYQTTQDSFLHDIQLQQCQNNQYILISKKYSKLTFGEPLIVKNTNKVVGMSIKNKNNALIFLKFNKNIQQQIEKIKKLIANDSNKYQYIPTGIIKKQQSHMEIQYQNNFQDTKLLYQNIKVETNQNQEINKVLPELVYSYSKFNLNNSLIGLNLKNCYMNKSSISGSPSFMKFPCLKSLNFSNNFLKNYGIIRFIMAQHMFPSLQELNLASNQITNEGFISLLAYNEFRYIKTLVLDENDIQKQYFHQVLIVFPLMNEFTFFNNNKKELCLIKRKSIIQQKKEKTEIEIENETVKSKNKCNSLKLFSSLRLIQILNQDKIKINIQRNWKVLSNQNRFQITVASEIKIDEQQNISKKLFKKYFQAFPIYHNILTTYHHKESNKNSQNSNQFQQNIQMMKEKEKNSIFSSEICELFIKELKLNKIKQQKEQSEHQILFNCKSPLLQFHENYQNQKQFHFQLYQALGQYLNLKSQAKTVQKVKDIQKTLIKNILKIIKATMKLKLKSNQKK